MACAEEVTYFEAFLNRKPSLHELYEHVRIGTNWYKLGVLFKLDVTKLNDVKLLNEDSDFKSLKMFELWLNTNPNATRKEMIETLRKDAIGENAIAENYKKALMESEHCMLIIRPYMVIYVLCVV